MALVACATEYPNTTFTPHSEYGRAIDFIWDRLLFLGTLVFILVEAALVFVVIKYRKRDDSVPPQTHGHTQLEILWTLIPAVILVFIAVPTVRTIFETQAKPVAGALNVRVIGHQWWWEFQYPEYTTPNSAGGVDTLITANELYLPIGRTVNLELTTEDVLHSFWVPQLAGKRDLIRNHTNYIWFTPDSAMTTSVWNGFCTEYCGASHANMRFRVYTVTADQFKSWTEHQLSPVAYNPVPPPAAPVTPPPAPGAKPGAKPAATPASNQKATVAAAAATQQTGGSAPAASPSAPTEPPKPGYTFPMASMPAYAIPSTPIPSELRRPAGLTGDAERGAKVYATASGSWTMCVACHTVRGIVSPGRVGPNLTHVGSRNTFGGGLFKTDEDHLFAWIKNARVMKPGTAMKTIGKDQFDPIENRVIKDGLTDQQIVDLVAYLQALK